MGVWARSSAFFYSKLIVGFEADLEVKFIVLSIFAAFVPLVAARSLW